MATAQLFFGNDQRSGDQQLAGASPLAVNVVVDGTGAVRRRPGISAWDGFPTTTPEASEITGITSFEDDIYYVNVARRIHRLSSGTDTDLSVLGVDSYLAGSERPTFAETAFRLVIAGGEGPSKVDSAATYAARLGGSPPDSTAVAALASRIFTNDLTDSSTLGRIRASGTGNAGNEDFDALDFVASEARPDPMVALRENSNELFSFGSTTLQVWSPDPNTILATSRAVNYGCAAPYSVILDEDQFAWLTERKTFVRGDARSIETLSGPINATLGQISTFDDCWGFRYDEDQFDTLIWMFPSDGRAFAKQEGSGWAQWHGWTDSAGYSLLPIRSHYYWPLGDVHLVGLANGRIAKFDATATDDLGATIKAEALTGFMNHDTDMTKTADCLRLTFKRGASSTAAHVMLSWRDKPGAWTSPIRIDLGTTGDSMPVVERRSLGPFRARQWRLEFTGARDLVLARAELEFSAGSN